MLYRAEIVGFVTLGLFIALLFGVCIYRTIKRRREESADKAKNAVNGGTSQVPVPQIVITTPVSPTPAIPQQQQSHDH